MTVIATPKSSITGVSPLVDETPPLEHGDRLTRDEFLRRYRVMPEVKKSELIEGRVYMSSPVSALRHGEPHADIVGWLFYYRAMTQGVIVGDNSTMVLDVDNLPQPDAYLRLDPQKGGQSKVGDDGFIHGPPELIVEVASTSASYDLHEKRNTYRRSGVQEYIVWQTYDGIVEYFALEGSDFVAIKPGDDGVYRSRVFPGLWLDAAALIRRDLAGVLAVSQRGIASPEHDAFVKRLAGLGS